MERTDAVLLAVDVRALVERARADGWTISYESDNGNWVGNARRGSTFLTAFGESIVEAVWLVLQKTHLSPIGPDLDDAA